MRKLKQIICIAVVACLISGSMGTMIHASNSKKEKYYKEYQKIVQEVNLDTDQTLELMPMEKMNDKDLIKPEKFEATIENIPEAEYEDIVLAGNLLKASSVLKGTFSKTKSCKVKVNSTHSITIHCKLTGNYYYDKLAKRCYFGKINNPTFTVSGGSWKNRGYTKAFIDNSRTADIEIKGTAVAGSNYTKKFSKSIEFYCSEEGNIK